MEDGDNSNTEVLSNTINKEENCLSILPNMANYPDIEVTVIKNKNVTENSSTKVNGQSESKDNGNEDDEDDSTDEDVLVIDEDHNKSQKKTNISVISRKRMLSPLSETEFKGFKKRMLRKSTEAVKIINECVNAVQLVEGDNKPSDNVDESIQGELDNYISQEANTKNITNDTETPLKEDNATHDNQNNTNPIERPVNDGNTQNKPLDPRPQNVFIKKLKVTGKKKKNPSPKQLKYAQYLGLQPAVKFKCYKCSESSFRTMTALSEHREKCQGQPSSQTNPLTQLQTKSTTAMPSTNFRLTRKVFLCSACGTYYENWNLFLHMREVHRRFICLYCLGMFSLVEKLSQHLITKHNCVPSQYNSVEDLLNMSKESLVLMCCHCERVFTEQENFYDHICTERTTTSSDKACWSCGSKGSTPHLVSCKASIEIPSMSSNNQKNKTNLKITNSKLTNKSMKKIPITNIEHVTADSNPSKPLSPNRQDTEQTCDIANLCTVDMEPTIKSEPPSPDKTPPEHSPSYSEENEPEIDKSQTEESHEGTKAAEQPEMDSNIPESSCDLSENNGTFDDNDTINNDDVITNSDKFNTAIDAQNEMLENSEYDDSFEQRITQQTEIEKDLDMSEHSDAENQKSSDIVSTEENENVVSETNNDSSESIEFNNKNIDTIVSNKRETNENLESVSEVNNMHNNQEFDTNSINDNNIEINEQTNRFENENKNMEIDDARKESTEEIRRVPKVTLKLPPPGTTFSDNDSEDSEKLMMEVDENEDSEQEEDNEYHENSSKETIDEDKQVNGYIKDDELNDERSDDGIPVADEDVAIVDLELEQPLDKFTTENLLKTCLGATIPTCIYCNHARKIVVNGKQLGLHAIAEHRFAATVDSITAEELIPHNFVVRIKEGLNDLEHIYFNLETKENDENQINNENNNFKRIYECFQCRYVTTIHKDLYLHNRKMHAKTILLCIICKSNFYTYSELICHLCPGNYDLSNEMKFRCCICDTGDLPSAFRLMVHLRKKHHTCDVCLEGCVNQSRLSNHVWKHKLHHLCYRCGIAYRNKPDITKHLFWKHGTESVLCKKCLQKKWPHVYHFCIPPTAFVCEECSLSFSRAVYLKVHKRLHNNEKKHKCTENNCTESFISKKLLQKHEKQHREPSPTPEPPPIENGNGDLKLEDEPIKSESLEKEILNENLEKTTDTNVPTEKEELPKPKIIDVLDLPALNLSESDSDDSDEELPKTSTSNDDPMKSQEKLDEPSIAPLLTEANEEQPPEEKQKELQIVDGIWENFKQYQATIEKRDSSFNMESKEFLNDQPKSDQEIENKSEIVEKLPDNIVNSQNEEVVEEKENEIKPDISVIMADHDYCLPIPENKVEKPKGEEKMDHDYCTSNENKSNVVENAENTEKELEKKKVKAEKKKNLSSSDSSSDSDSSSCTCGSNCSCSSSSGSSSSSSSSSDSDSSSSEGKRRIEARRKRREERAKRKQKASETSQVASNTSAIDVVTEENLPPQPLIEIPIQESDLDTDETETDEDFYDEHPQRIANKLLEEKRNQLMLLAGVAPPVSNGSIVECSRPSTPSIPEETTAKKKIKSKKRKKKNRSSTPKQSLQQHIPVYQNHIPSPLAAPVSAITTIVHRSPLPSPVQHVPTVPTVTVPRHIIETPKPVATTGSSSETETNVRSSKRKRVPNKFYGYSSDDETSDKPPAPPILKWRKHDLPSNPSHVTVSPKIVPPIMIKNIPSPAPIIEPVHQPPVVHHTEVPDSDSDVEDSQQRKSSSDSSDSNHNDDSDSDTGQLHISQPHFTMQSIPMAPLQRSNENLYCYCQCPYDEVSEMIACDGRDCAIEWFHFECVGIMVPPKGKWFCPDCRKKSAPLRNDFIQT